MAFQEILPTELEILKEIQNGKTEYKFNLKENDEKGEAQSVFHLKKTLSYINGEDIDEPGYAGYKNITLTHQGLSILDKHTN